MLITIWTVESKDNASKSLLQEESLPFRSLWIMLFRSPRKTHAIFIRDTYEG